ncbi:hypothetical protein C0Q70_20954 [Pomacea canaliculata]|uniref:Gfo/Idh/MocA-like oxidoreductase N-terminal domain-containing protein n=1 Tax=Pomacea canaliculata TaxID=400727 RepID=A0A2T7NB62_POMCA|nr:hypothetical protein C0Q70_20954 [Pomacea canaliculata]
MVASRFGFAILGMGNMEFGYITKSESAMAVTVSGEGGKAFCGISVDAVVICSPTTAHEDQIQRCLKAGKAVFSEKPVTPELSTTTACYRLAEIKNKPLFCAFHRRFDPSIRQVYADVQSRKLGEVKMIQISSHDPQYPPVSYIKTSGGIAKDSTIHDLDLSLWITGSLPKRVFCQGGAFNPEVRACGDHDLVIVTVQFQNGTICVIDNGRQSAQGYDQRLQVLCQNGGYTVSNRSTLLTSTLEHKGSSLPPCESHFVIRYADAYRLEMEHFLNVLEGKEEMAVKQEDTLAAMALAEAVAKSATTGQPVDM